MPSKRELEQATAKYVSFRTSRSEDFTDEQAAHVEAAVKAQLGIEMDESFVLMYVFANKEDREAFEKAL